MKPSRLAFSALELLVVIATICLVIAAFVPGRSRTRSRAPRINCVNNLKQIGLAFRTWPTENDTLPMRVSVTNGGSMELMSSGSVFPHLRVMSNELSTPKILICPAEKDPRRIAATTFQSIVPPGSSAIPFTSDYNISYFIGLDTTDSVPEGFLAGDRWFSVNGRVPGHGMVTIPTNSILKWSTAGHNGCGNIGLSDGSVQQASSTYLQRLFINIGTNVTRLAFP